VIRVTDIRVSTGSNGARLSAVLHCEGTSLHDAELWFQYPYAYRDHISTSADPWIAILLWPAMRLGRRLVVDAVGSSKLMESLPTLMSIMHCWDSRFRPIEVQVQGLSARPCAGTAVAGFFSGGVDSFYTALKHAPLSTPVGKGITHLISVHGLDILLRDRALWGEIRDRLCNAARGLGCTWVEASTNVRDVVSDRLVSWWMHFGAVLAGIALGTEGIWREVLIPAAQTYLDLFPAGSHPLMDPLWSTESMRIVSDGAEATRIQKVAWQIARSSVALRHLRVCWENRDRAYNCGRCEKCIRTMVALKLAGVLDRCTSFDHPLSSRSVRRVRFASSGQRNLMIETYEAARAAGLDPPLVGALRSSLYPPLHRRLRRSLSRRGRALVRRMRHMGSGPVPLPERMAPEPDHFAGTVRGSMTAGVSSAKQMVEVKHVSSL
jgi:hypothetical protein